MIAILIFGAASAVTRKLTDIGANNLINGHNPISFCNVLFVGNLCALLIFMAIYQKQWRAPVLKRISWQQWLTLTVIALLSSAIIPALIFSALALTSVNNVILIGQLDTPLVLALSVFFLGDRSINGSFSVPFSPLSASRSPFSFNRQPAQNSLAWPLRSV